MEMPRRAFSIPRKRVSDKHDATKCALLGLTCDSHDRDRKNQYDPNATLPVVRFTVAGNLAPRLTQDVGADRTEGYRTATTTLPITDPVATVPCACAVSIKITPYRPSSAIISSITRTGALP